MKALKVEDSVNAACINFTDYLFCAGRVYKRNNRDTLRERGQRTVHNRPAINFADRRWMTVSQLFY